MKSLSDSYSILSQSDLANVLGVTEWTIWAMRKRGELPAAVRIGRQVKWRPEVIEKWLIQKEKPASEFDVVFSDRAQKAAASRGQSQNINNAKKQPAKKIGRPTKKSKIEGNLA